MTMPATAKPKAPRTKADPMSELLRGEQSAATRRLWAAHQLIETVERDTPELEPQNINVPSAGYRLLEDAGFLAHGKVPVTDAHTLLPVLRSRRATRTLCELFPDGVATLSKVAAEVEAAGRAVTTTRAELTDLESADADGEPVLATQAAKLGRKLKSLKAKHQDAQDRLRLLKESYAQLQSKAPEPLRTHAQRRLREIRREGGNLRLKELDAEIRLIESRYLHQFEGTRKYTNGWPRAWVELRCPSAVEPAGNGNPCRPHPERYPEFLKDLDASLPALKQERDRLAEELEAAEAKAWQLVDEWIDAGGSLSLELLEQAS
jgi:hypothetical protein